MTIPKRFWRFSYDSELFIEKMLTSSTLITPKLGPRNAKYDPDKVIRTDLRVGDGLFLAKFDENDQSGQITAIGIVRSVTPALVVDWKRHSKTLYPNTGGFEPWRCRCFKFEKVVAERYNLAEDYKSQF